MEGKEGAKEHRTTAVRIQNNWCRVSSWSGPERVVSREPPGFQERYLAPIHKWPISAISAPACAGPICHSKGQAGTADRSDPDFNPQNTSMYGASAAWHSKAGWLKSSPSLTLNKIACFMDGHYLAESAAFRRLNRIKTHLACLPPCIFGKLGNCLIRV